MFYTNYSRYINHQRKVRRDSLRITMMLVLVVTIFLLIEIPLMVIATLHALSTKANQLMDYELAGNAVLFINTFTCLTCPINFSIYCSMSKQFRDTFFAIFVESLQKTEQPTFV